MDSRSSKRVRQADARRNLYVLGLPFDLTKAEFVELFSRYGVVSHAVILATVDNASRRRGFVVMGSHREAKFAMDVLSRKEINLLSTLLTGFLDGGDRTMMLSQARTPTACSTLDYGPFDASPSPPGDICSPSAVQLQPEPPVSSAVPTLLVTNLPGVLFSQPADLHPLLCPFGDIEHLKIVTDETTAAQGKISVVVEYKTLGQAKDARDALSGQIYVDEPVKAELLYSNLPPVASQEANTWCPATGDMKTGLNPFAAPFHVQTTLAQARPMLPAPFCNEAQPLNRYEGLSKWSNDSPVSDSPYLSLPAFHSSVYSNLGLCAPQPTTSRPRSAPSDSTKVISNLRPGYWSSSQDLPSFSLRSSFSFNA
ncbi:hypothetical protein PHLCEN_2v1174 [Hermanssonia centrifuga]|uniref:RRM domain-containing protein n=1 Tax=Hermanssonia centrifuga TaxID=98765 RepID=A0A2R6S3V2_9APHY|nr:hypothetical protein PHLCEN_2v1174 [Hermanssonia centrifuga]